MYPIRTFLGAAWPIIWTTLISLQLCAFTAATVYYDRGHSWWRAFIAGLVLGPLATLLALLTPVNEQVREQRRYATGHWRPCPECWELVRWNATICRFCHGELPIAIRDLSTQTRKSLVVVRGSLARPEGIEIQISLSLLSGLVMTTIGIVLVMIFAN